MKNNYLITLGSTIILSGLVPSVAEASGTDVNWNSLNLNSKQKCQIQSLNKDWININYKIRPELAKDQDYLRLLLKNPGSNENDIREAHWKIQYDQHRLRSEALENFLAKRRILSTAQRKKLHQMLSK